MPITEQVRFSGERKRDFALWIYDEITNTKGDRSALEKKWSDAIVQWRAAMPQGTKEFPWIGASNVEFPLTAIHADPVYADFMQSIHAPPEYWTVTANRPDRVEHAHPMTEFAKRVEQQFLKMRRVNQRALLYNNVLGTSIYKNHWLHERKEVRDYVDGAVAKRVKVRSQPLIEAIPLQHFWVPADAWSLDPDDQGGARWKAQEFHLTTSQLRLRAKAESPNVVAYTPEAVEKVILFESTPEVGVDDKLRELDKFKPWREPRVRLFEVWTRFDADGDGIEEDIVCIFHLETMTVLRALYHPQLHGKDPWHRTTYLPGFGIYGMGIAELDHWAQATSTKLLNATIDNVVLANTQMWQAPYGSSLQPGESMYPGKILFVGPGEDIKPLKMGEVYPSIFNIQQQIMQWSEMRTGVNEIRQGGFGGMPSRTPATSLLSIMQEGNKRFDMIHSNFRDVHGEMGLRMLQNMAQAYAEDPAYWMEYCTNCLGQADAEKVIEVFQSGATGIEESFGVNITATSAQNNKEAEKQSMLGLMQVLQQSYPNLVQMAQMVMQAPPGTPIYDTAVAAYVGGVQMLERLIEKFDIQNPEQFIPNLDILMGQMQSQQQAGMMQQPQLGVVQGGAPGASPQQPNPMLGWEQLGNVFGIG